MFPSSPDWTNVAEVRAWIEEKPGCLETLYENEPLWKPLLQARAWESMDALVDMGWKPVLVAGTPSWVVEALRAQAPLWLLQRVLPLCGETWWEVNETQRTPLHVRELTPAQAHMLGSWGWQTRTSWGLLSQATPYGDPRFWAAREGHVALHRIWETWMPLWRA